MALTESPLCRFGWKAKNFKLPAIDGKDYAFSDIQGEKGTLLMFICNHCPYVQAVAERIARDAKDLQRLGIGVAAIMPNDWDTYPDDDFENMKRFSKKHGFTFPYMADETQKVARAYDAVCTPDFFGFDQKGGLQYRGRLDASRMDPAPADARRDLYEAMAAVAKTGKGPKEQIASMGCSIKWRA